MRSISPWFNPAYIMPHACTDMDAYPFYRAAAEGYMRVAAGLDRQGPRFDATLSLDKDRS